MEKAVDVLFFISYHPFLLWERAEKREFP